MPDLGTRRLLQDGSHPSDGPQMLRRIAEILGRPVSDFYRLDEAVSESTKPSAAECALALMAFRAVKDADARARIVDMMRTCSGN